jgi:hypothetical protein
MVKNVMAPQKLYEVSKSPPDVLKMLSPLVLKMVISTAAQFDCCNLTQESFRKQLHQVWKYIRMDA